MFVSESMSPKVITIDQDASMMDARALMKENKIRHLPVVEDEDRLIGIVTDRDIRSALPLNYFKDQMSDTEKQFYANIPVRDIMTPDPVTVSPFDTLQDALLLIQKYRVGAFPVADANGRLKGIISVRDLLRAFINVLGIGEPGSLLGIVAEEKVGQMKKIVDTITEENVSFGSILVARYREKHKRAVFPYLLTLNTSAVKKRLEKAGFQLIDPMSWYLDQLPKNE